MTSYTGQHVFDAMVENIEMNKAAADFSDWGSDAEAIAINAMGVYCDDMETGYHPLSQGELKCLINLIENHNENDDDA